MISPYWTVGLFLHKDTSPRTLTFFHEISKESHGCRMKAVVRDSGWKFTTNYYKHKDLSGSVFTEVYGMEMDLLIMVLKQMNVTFVHVPTPKRFRIAKGSTNNLTRAMFAEYAFIALGKFRPRTFVDPFLDSSISHYNMTYRWYVPCSVKYPRWSSIYRILSVELWIVLIISIVIAAISTTLVARFSCTSEWQRYKTLSSSLTNLWAVMLGVSVSTMPRTPSLRSLFIGWVCFSVAFCTVFQAFLTSFLIDSGYKTPIRNMEELLASGI